LNQEGLSHKDEFVRHKVLDCLGDLYLSGFFLSGKITCKQGGHELTASLLNKIFENSNNYNIENSVDNTYSKINKKLTYLERVERVV